MIRGTLIIVTLAGLSLFTARANQTASVTLAWTPSSSPNTAGYNIYYGTSSSNYTSSLNVSNVADVMVPGLTNGTTYYFAAKTYSSSGSLSTFSPEISYVAGTTSAIPAAIMAPVTPSGQFSFSVAGTAGFEYAVEASTNLVNWVVLGTNTAPFKFVDTNASQFRHRFYRAVYAPNVEATLTPVPGQIILFSTVSGHASFTVSGTPGYPYAVEASTNMVNWVILGTNNAPFVFADTNANQFSHRFYRAVPAPYAAITSGAATTTTSPVAGKITSTTVSVPGQFRITVSGTAGYPYAVEASTNMVNWVILGTNNAPFIYIDTNASQFSHRFYRAVPAPDAAITSTSVTVTTSPAAGKITSASVNGLRLFRFTVSGTAGYPYAVEASTNMVNWVILGTNNAPFIFVDTNTSQFGHRFYRAVPAPDAAASLGAVTITSPAAGKITSTFANIPGMFRFKVSGTAGYPYAVEASTNMVNWVILGTNNAPFIFVDTNASQFSHRFYRAVPAPDAAASIAGASTVTQSPAPAITSASVNMSGHFGFTVTGIPGDQYAVEASTNMVNWTILETNAAPFNFVDMNAINYSRRFYRAVYVPN